MLDFLNLLFITTLHQIVGSTWNRSFYYNFTSLAST